MTYKLIFKLVNKVLAINITYYKLVFKRLKETNLKHR